MVLYELLPHQIEHTDKILQALTKNHGILDTSTMGSGKTYTTTYISDKLQLPMLIISPVTIIKTWEKMIAMGANIIGIYSYESLRGCKHGLLIKDEKTFKVTDEYIKLLDNGIMLVMDESSKIKNKTANITEAIRVMIRAMVTRSTNSRYIMLSATPYDKDIFMIESVRTLGFTEKKQLSKFDIGTGTHDVDGLKDVIKACKRLDKEGTRTILDSYGPITIRTKIGTARKIVKDLFIQVIKPNIIFAMSNPIVGDLGTLYGNMSNVEYKRYKIAIDNLAELLLIPENGNMDVEITESIFGKLSLILRDLEHAKLGIFAREAHRFLLQDPNNKVIVNFNYTSSISMFIERITKLTDILPAVMYGDTRIADRNKIIDLFNEPNDKLRLLVSTIGTCSMGISLHDLDGRFPRYTLISPSYSIQNLHQASGRTVRSGAKSLATIRMIYGKRADQEIASDKEQKILDALSRKKDTMKSILDQAVKDGIRFPGEYEIIPQSPDIMLVDQDEKYSTDIGINTIESEECDKILRREAVYIPESGEKLKAKILSCH